MSKTLEYLRNEEARFTVLVRTYKESVREYEEKLKDIRYLIGELVPPPIVKKPTEEERKEFKEPYTCAWHEAQYTPTLNKGGE